MAVKRFEGGAAAVAQVNTWTFTGTWVIGDLITFRCGNKVYAYAITNATIATFHAALVTAYNALSGTTYPELAEMTAAGTSPAFTLTADSTTGRPFTVTLETNSAAGLINGGAVATAGTATTAAAGPHDWSTAANWSDAAVPITGDTVYLDANDSEILYGLAQSAVTLAALHILGTFTGKIGLPLISQDGTAYPEYRADYLAIGATACNIGFGEGDGSARIKINFGTVQTTVNVYGSSTGENTELEAILLKGTHASNALNVTRGEVGVAVIGGEAATLLTLRQGFQQNVSGDAQVRIGSTVTLGTVDKAGGQLECNSAIATSLTQTGGDTVINGTGAVAQLNARGGRVVYNTTGTLGGDTVVSDGAMLDFDQDQRAKTVTNPINCFGGGQVRDTNKVVAALVVDYTEFDPGFGLGKNIRLTRGAVA